MKSPEHTCSAVERLYGLTLLVDEAIDKEAFHVVTSLLEQREKTIDLVESEGVQEEERETLDRIMALDRHMQSKLSDMRSGALAGLRALTNEKTCLATYQRNR